MKQFFIVLIGIILLLIFMAFIVATFTVETVAKILAWLTGFQRHWLESLRSQI